VAAKHSAITTRSAITWIVTRNDRNLSFLVTNPHSPAEAGEPQPASAHQPAFLAPESSLDAPERAAHPGCRMGMHESAVSDCGFSFGARSQHQYGLEHARAGKRPAIKSARTGAFSLPAAKFANGTRLEWSPKLRQTVKTHFSANGELSHGVVTQTVHARI
jgi:hypothetical protein